MGIYIWRRKFVNRTMLLLVILLGLLCHTVCKTHINCSIFDDPQPIPHNFYQPGDLLIGGIVSQVLYLYNNLSFTEQPGQVLINEPM